MGSELITLEDRHKQKFILGPVGKYTSSLK